jgi:hypothetical protein
MDKLSWSCTLGTLWARVTIEPIEPPAGQQIVAAWRASGVIGAWAHRKPKSTSARWARQLRRKASQRAR